MQAARNLPRRFDGGAQTPGGTFEKRSGGGRPAPSHCENGGGFCPHYVSLPRERGRGLVSEVGCGAAGKGSNVAGSNGEVERISRKRQETAGNNREMVRISRKRQETAGNRRKRQETPGKWSASAGNGRKPQETPGKWSASAGNGRKRQETAGNARKQQGSGAHQQETAGNRRKSQETPGKWSASAGNGRKPQETPGNRRKQQKRQAAARKSRELPHVFSGEKYQPSRTGKDRMSRRRVIFSGSVARKHLVAKP